MIATRPKGLPSGVVRQTEGLPCHSGRKKGCESHFFLAESQTRVAFEVIGSEREENEKSGHIINDKWKTDDTRLEAGLYLLSSLIYLYRVVA